MVTTATQDKIVKECIDLCTQCANMCQECIDYCLQQGGKHVAPQHMKTMIDCAEICRTAANYMLRGSAYMGKMCGLCAEVCRACADSCGKMTEDKMMQECADLCQRCAESCQQMAK